jgi:integrase
MRRVKQNGMIVRINDRWYLRYWERRNVRGSIERKRVSHQLGPVTTRGKKPPADIVGEAERHMADVNSGVFAAERIVTVGDFVEVVYLPWIGEHKRPSTVKGYRDIWEIHLRPLCAALWMKNVRTHDVQGWLSELGRRKLSRNTLKNIKSVISAIFRLAKQQDYFRAENPAHDTAISPAAPAPSETHAYGLDEIHAILTRLPEPAATAFAVAAYAGLRHGEIQGLRWEDYRGGQLYVSRSIWNGRIGEPKTRRGRAPVPVIPHLANRLALHRIASGNPQDGPIFRNAFGRPISLPSVVNRVVLPTLNRCASCGKPELRHPSGHRYRRDDRLPKWHGWHAARRGLGSNLYRLGVPMKVIQAILRHSNVNTTATYYVMTADEDTGSAMAKLQEVVGGGARASGDLPPVTVTLPKRPIVQ